MCLNGPKLPVINLTKSLMGDINCPSMCYNVGFCWDYLILLNKISNLNETAVIALNFMKKFQTKM